MSNHHRCLFGFGHKKRRLGIGYVIVVLECYQVANFKHCSPLYISGASSSSLPLMK